MPGDIPNSISVHAIGTPDSSKVTFAGSNATLVLDQPPTFSGTLASFGAKDHIDLPSIAFGTPATLGYTDNSTNTGGVLTIVTALTLPQLLFSATTLRGASSRRPTAMAER